jgi:hypothetical protein
MWAVLTVAAYHANYGNKLVHEIVEDCSVDELSWLASLQCYNSLGEIVVTYPFTGLTVFLAAMLWELRQGITPKRRQ